MSLFRSSSTRASCTTLFVSSLQISNSNSQIRAGSINSLLVCGIPRSHDNAYTRKLFQSILSLTGHFSLGKSCSWNHLAPYLLQTDVLSLSLAPKSTGHILSFSASSNSEDQDYLIFHLCSSVNSQAVQFSSIRKYQSYFSESPALWQLSIIPLQLCLLGSYFPLSDFSPPCFMPSS